MEAVCVKLDDGVLKNIDFSVKKNNFTTRTDFIREAIRDKLRMLEKERAIKKLERFLGAAKVKVSDKRHEEVRREVVKKYAKKFGLDLE